MIFDAPSFDDHEKVVFGHDRETGLKAIIAIHRLGPEGRALGGCRMTPYASEEEALDDVLRLSKGMTYKAAVANLHLGGAKSVIIGDPTKHKSDALLRAMGRFVESMNGQYITSVDVGVSGPDVGIMASETRWAVGAGDPSPTTSLGVFEGIKAAIKYRLNTDDLSTLTISVLGVGKVGYALCKLLSERGANLIVADVHRESAQKAALKFEAKVVSPDDIVSEQVDVFAPCALGGILNNETIAKLNTGIVAGAANNQLMEDRHADVLRAAGILYAPDYVINAGGLIQVASEIENFSDEEARARTVHIHDTLLEIFAKADSAGISTLEAASRLALERYQARAIAAE